jgi:hypothetical protein
MPRSPSSAVQSPPLQLPLLQTPNNKLLRLRSTTPPVVVSSPLSQTPNCRVFPPYKLPLLPELPTYKHAKNITTSTAVFTVDTQHQTEIEGSRQRFFRNLL